MFYNSPQDPIVISLDSKRAVDELNALHDNISVLRHGPGKKIKALKSSYFMRSIPH